LENIDKIIQEIRKIIQVKKIILISKKLDISGEITSFKLCIVLAENNVSVSEIEQSLYMEIDSDISFDLVLYTNNEWDELKDSTGSFAWKINTSGAVLFEA
jgi:hypothetical protein